jgi:hypothetical protein
MVYSQLQTRGFDGVAGRYGESFMIEIGVIVESGKMDFSSKGVPSGTVTLK